MLVNDIKSGEFAVCHFSGQTFNYLRGEILVCITPACVILFLKNSTWFLLFQSLLKICNHLLVNVAGMHLVMFAMDSLAQDSRAMSEIAFNLFQIPMEEKH